MKWTGVCLRSLSRRQDGIIVLTQSITASYEKGHRCPQPTSAEDPGGARLRICPVVLVPRSSPLSQEESDSRTPSPPSPSQSLGSKQSLGSELRLVATTFSSTFQPGGWGLAGPACTRQEGHRRGMTAIAETVQCWGKEPGRSKTYGMPHKVTPADLSGQRKGRQQRDSWMTG